MKRMKIELENIMLMKNRIGMGEREKWVRIVGEIAGM